MVVAATLRASSVVSVVSTMTGRPKLRSLRVFCSSFFFFFYYLPESCMHAGLMLTVGTSSWRSNSAS